MVISYEEALRARTKPTSTPSLLTTFGLLASDSTQPLYKRRPHPSEPESRYGTGSYGYQGAVNPVFVSLNAEENVAIRSRIPTPPPRNYFPVTGGDEYGDNAENAEDYNFYNNKIDEIDSGYGITTFSYNDEEAGVTTGGYDRFDSYYDAVVTPPSVMTTERPGPSYYSEDDIWAGYSKVVQDLLRDREYPRPVSLSSLTSVTSGLTSGNKFVGEPQSVSTRPLIVSPNMDSSDLGDQPRDQPRDDLLTSYSDRYGWGQSQAYRDSLREFNR